MQATKAHDKYLKRFLLALPVAAALVLTFLFFSPVEMVMLNASSFQFTAMGTAVPIMGLVSLACILIGAALLALFRGKLYDVFMAMVLGLTLCLYIQGTFLTGSTPKLSGDEAAWSTMKKEMLINLAVWAALFAIPLVLRRFKEAWHYTRVLLPLIIIVMQLTGFISLLGNPEATNTEAGYLGYEDFTAFSGKGDTLVFMLDRLDHEYIDAVLEKDPRFFDRLDGFTRYDNAISQFAHTRPGMKFILSNYDETLFKEPASDYFYHSWDDGERHILQDLSNAGYTVDLYAELPSMLGKNYASFTPYVSNLRLGTNNISVKLFVLRMSILSAYRDFPLILKPYFSSKATNYKRVFNRSTSFDPDMTIFDQSLSKMQFDSDKPFFKFFEFKGSHSPYRLNADGSSSGKKTDVISQTMGSFEILLRALDRMKAAGTYKDTAIIITADHGYMGNDYEPMTHPTRIGLFYKPAGVEGTPLQTTYAPVSLRNIPATILKASGLDYSAYGVPLDEVPDDQSIVRDYIRTIADHDVGWKDVWALYYDVAYDAADMDSWTLKRTEKVEYSLGF